MNRPSGCTALVYWPAASLRAASAEGAATSTGPTYQLKAQAGSVRLSRTGVSKKTGTGTSSTHRAVTWPSAGDADVSWKYAVPIVSDAAGRCTLVYLCNDTVRLQAPLAYDTRDGPDIPYRPASSMLHASPCLPMLSCRLLGPPGWKRFPVEVLVGGANQSPFAATYGTGQPGRHIGFIGRNSPPGGRVDILLAAAAQPRKRRHRWLTMPWRTHGLAEAGRA
jgi:hypothetical protein